MVRVLVRDKDSGYISRFDARAAVQRMGHFGSIRQGRVHKNTETIASYQGACTYAAAYTLVIAFAPVPVS